ncbi:MAG: hypothetical protein ACKV19_14235 [Verrucomicrobiales bacterium]
MTPTAPHPTAPAARPAFKPDYPTESAARAAGWHPVTSAFLLPVDLDLLQTVLAGFRGERPGHRRVDMVLVGDGYRLTIARRASELIGVEDVAAPTAPEPTTVAPNDDMPAQDAA